MKRYHMVRTVLLAFLIAGAALIARGWAAPDAASDSAYAAPGFAPMSATQMQAALDEVLPVYLLVLHAALNQSDDATTFDTLASIADGAALDALFLARDGRLASAGLKKGTQQVHEIDLLSTDVTRQGDALSVLVVWQVIGLSNHAGHTHARGGTYGAAITLAPAGGTWKITRFALGAPGQNLTALREG